MSSDLSLATASRRVLRNLAMTTLLFKAPAGRARKFRRAKNTGGTGACQYVTPVRAWSARVHFVVELAHDLVMPHALVPELFVPRLVDAVALEKAADVVAALDFYG